MYLFARSRTLSPAHAREAVGMAVEAGSKVTEVSGLQVSVWTTMFSPQVGTILWTARAESLSELEAAADKWSSDGPLMDWIERSDHLWSSSATDALTEVVHGVLPPQPASYISTVQAAWAPGEAAEAMAVGVEVTDTFNRLTGAGIVFGRAVTGPFAGVGWVSSFPDLAAMEAAQAAIGGDEGWLELMGRASRCYQPGATTSILRKIG